MRILANLTIAGTLDIDTVLNANADTDRFLVQESGGVVRFRTGAEVLSDIGGQGALTLTTTGTSGAATLVGNTLNIPQYEAEGNYVTTATTLTINGTTYDLSANRSWSVGTVTSVAMTVPAAFAVAGSPITGAGTLAVTAIGTSSQYIRGDGSLATIPSTSSGGSSVNYYLNGSVAASVAGYQQMANSAIIGGGTNFTLVGNGLIAQFLTDVANPNRILIPGGAWNFEMYFNISSSGGNAKFYVELLKYDGTTFTSIASSSAVPEQITGGTTVDLYLTSLAVPETVLLTTDRLAVRVYIVDNSGGRTVTLHTEDNTLCDIITSFAGGIAALNGLTANTQYLAVGTSGTDFNILSVSDTHTFNLPTASASNRGALSSADWTKFNTAYNDSIVSAAVTGTTTKTLTLTQQDAGTITASWTDINTDAVTSVFGRTGAVVATSGDYTTAQVTEVTNLYYTEARVNANTNVSANTAARHNAVTLGTANGLSLSTQVLSLALASTSVTGALSSTDWNTFNGKQNALTLTTTGTSGAATLVGATLNIPQYQSAGTYVTSVTGTSPIVSSGGTTPAISIPAATTSVNGYLTSTDWTIFNGKFNLPSLTAGSVLFSNGTTIAQDNANFFWDDTNNRLGIGTASPVASLDLYKSSAINGPMLSIRADFTAVGKFAMIRFGDQSQTTLYQKGAFIYEGVAGSARGRMHIALENTDTSASVALTDARLTVQSDGNVGIGTTSPATRLQVMDSANTYSAHFSGLNQVNGIAIGTNSLNVALIQGYTRTFSATNAISINSAGGNVLLGTTTDNTIDRLQVSGSASISGTLTGASSIFTNVRVNANGEGVAVIGNTGNPAYLVTDQSVNNSGKRWRVGHTGAIGGFSSFDIYNQTDNITPLTIASTGAATFSSSVTAGSTVLVTGTVNSTAGSFAIDHAGVNTWRIGITNSNTSTFSIGNDNGGSFATKVLNITNAGNVGIGTTSPYQAKLDVSGINGVANIAASNSSLDQLLIGSIDRASAPAFFSLPNGSSFVGAIGNGVANTLGIGTFGAAPLIFGTSNTERMRITSGGNLLLGTTTDSGQKFQVNGNIVVNPGYIQIINTSNAGLYLNNTSTQWQVYDNTSNEFIINNGAGTTALSLAYSTGAATFSSSITAASANITGNLTVDTNTLFVDATNNRVGIGTTSTTYTLEVNSGAAQYLNTRFYSSSHSLLMVESTTAGFQSIITHKSPTRQYTVGLQGDGTYSIYDNTAAANRLILSTSGNLGLGVTPSAWGTYVAMQVTRASLWGAVNNAYVGANYYYDGTNRRYISTGFATEYAQASGEHQWLIAASATAGATATFTQAMTLNASGNLLIGNTTNRLRLTVSGSDANAPTLGTASGTTVFANAAGTTEYGMNFGVSSSGYGWIQQHRFDGTATAYNLSLQPSGGNLLLGTATDDLSGSRLQVAGSGRFSVASASSTSPTLFLTQAAGTYSSISAVDAYHGIVFRGIPSNFTNYAVTPGDQMSFYEWGGDFRFYKKNYSELTLQAYIQNGAATFSSSVTASSIIKSGGTSSQFLKADGSVDSNTYVTGGPYLPLAGGTMTGGITFGSATTYTPLRFTGGVADYTVAEQDGAGRVNWYWNKSGTGGAPTYQVSSEDAIRLKFSTAQAAGAEAGIGVYYAAAGTAGAAITWTEVMGAFHNGFRVLPAATFSSSVTAAAFNTGPYVSRGFTITEPAINFGNGRNYIRLHTTSSGTRISSFKIRISSTWYYAAAFGYIDADVSYYFDGTSLVNPSVTVTSATGQALNALAVGQLVIEGGYVSLPVYETNTNPIYVKIEGSPNFDYSLITTSGWTSFTFPGQNIVNVPGAISVVGAATFSSSVTATSFLGNATTATNILNTGTVTLASATEANSIYITQPSYTTDKPVKLLNFDWYGNLFSIGNIRSGASASLGLGFYYTNTGGTIAEIARFSTLLNLLIGTTTDNTVDRLQVSGSGLFTGNVKIYTGGYPLLDLGLSSSNYFRLIFDNPNDTFVINKNNGSALFSLTIAGAATFSSSVTAGNNIQSNKALVATGSNASWTGAATFMDWSATYGRIGAYSYADSLWKPLYINDTVYITANGGNVLIGTTTDAGYKLDVNGTGRFSGALTVTNASGVPVSVTSTSVTSTFVLDNTNANLWGGVYAVRVNGVDKNYFGTLGSLLGSTNTDATIWATSGNGFRVYTNGNNKQLEITTTGAATFSSSVTAGGNIFADAGNNEGFKLNGGLAMYRVDGTTLGFFTNDLQRMCILSGGNVGIGTTSPAAKLDVYKGAQSNTISLANSTAWLRGVDVGLAIGQDNGAGGYGTWIQSIRTDNTSFSLAINPNGGNVKIGTLTDNGTDRLQVSGSGLFSSSVTSLQLIGISASNQLKLVLSSDPSYNTLFSVNGLDIYGINQSFSFKFAGGSPVFTLANSGAATFSSSVTASSLIKSGGTSAQILAADGSVITAGTNITISGGTISATAGASGITSLNTLTAATQTFAVGTSGTDFNISSATSTHTFNIPDASPSNRGLVTTTDQTLNGIKRFRGGITTENTGSALTMYYGIGGGTFEYRSSIGTLSDGAMQIYAQSNLQYERIILGMNGATVAGNVLIGKTTDDFGKLQVAGATSTTNLILGAGTATVSPISFTTGVLKTTPATGDMEVNGGYLFYTASARRGVISPVQWIANTATRTFVANTNSQNMFDTGSAGANTFTAVANTTYIFEVQINLTGLSGTNNAVGFGFALTGAVVSNISYMSIAEKANTIGTPTAPNMCRIATTATTAVTPSTNQTAAAITIKGIVRFTTGGSVTPVISQIGATAASVLGIGSYVKFQALGSNTDTKNPTNGWA